MRRATTSALLLFVLMPGLTRAHSATNENPNSSATWALISKQPVDPRIEAEVNRLAGDNKAALAVVNSRAEASSKHPALTIELNPAQNASTFAQELSRLARSSAPTAETARQGYRLDVLYLNGPSVFVAREVKITALEPEGCHHGVLRLAQVLRALASHRMVEISPKPKSAMITEVGATATISIADFPSFSVRGVVEGFYGEPWSHQDRLDILRFEGEHGMNSYYYAPKDDPYHRQNWRDPYPPDRLSQLGELAQTAREQFVDFCFAISPGLSMVYASDADFSKLTEKLDSVGKLGISCYALFLDDVPEELQNPADKARFKSLAEAHAYIINKLYQHVVSISPHNHLTVTPTTYTNGFGSREYVRELGAAVNLHVDLVWTGPEVVSPTITVAATQDWGKMLRRPPLIWDNYPVNDFARWRPFLGPLVGRDPDLNTAAKGLVSNPMNEAHASMIPLAAIAEYVWNPPAYNPTEAERRALVSQYGKDGPDLLAPFLKTYSDYRWQNNNVFKLLYNASRLPIDLPDIKRRLDPMDQGLQALGSRPGYEKLVAELGPLVQKTQARADALASDPGYRRLSDGRVEPDPSYDVLEAQRLASAPALDGDFAKWQSGKLYDLRELAPPAAALNPPPPKPPGPFAGRFALGWDSRFLYVGVDITDPDVYAPPPGTNITEGDMIALAVETAFRRNYYATSAPPDAFTLHLSPGNFNDVAPNMSTNKGRLAARISDSGLEVTAAWKKTPQGYSGDIAIPSAYFDSKFQEGCEIGLLVEAQKVAPAAGPPQADAANNRTPREWLVSRQDQFFRPTAGNPSTYQRLVLVGRP
jgi:hypothetical protein